jgi:hypothetical protein
MCYQGVHNWPPLWTQDTKRGTKTISGEVGVLTYVYSNTRVSNKCYLVIEYERENYVGALIFDNHPFCAQVALVLQSHVGRPIQEIGDLELP